VNYDLFVKSNIKKAFAYAKDFTKDITIRSFTNYFDFNTSENYQSISNTTVKALILDTDSKDRNIKRKKVYIITETFPYLKLTDVVLLNSLEWKVGEEIKDNGYLTHFNIFRE